MTAGHPAWEILWPQVNWVVERLRDGLGDTIGDQLVGPYLSGSLAQEASTRIARALARLGSDGSGSTQDPICP
jgi:hypothetical protein